MLKNKQGIQKLIYNGIDKDVLPGQSLDVRDFNILNEHVKIIENHFLRKYPGVFDQIETIDNVKIANQYSGEIEVLKSKNKAIQNELDDLKRSSKQQSEKIGSMSEELSGFAPKEKGLRDQIAKLTKQLEDQKEEYEGIINRMNGGKARK